VSNDTPVKVISDLQSRSIFPLTIGSRGKAAAIIQIAIKSPANGVLSEKDILKLQLLKRKVPVEQSELLSIAFIKGNMYFPLKKGSVNNYVAALQVLLGIQIDGKFGTGTEKALEDLTGSKIIDWKNYINLFRRIISNV